MYGQLGSGDKVMGVVYIQRWMSNVRLLLIVIHSLFVTNVLSQEIIPILQPLAVQQRAMQMKSAPSGHDSPLVSVLTPEQIPIQVVEVNEEPSEIEKKVTEALNDISLEEKIQKQRVQEKLEQFGYNLFSQIPVSMPQALNVTVPPDYLISPGDTLIVQLYGKTNVEYKLVVTRNGTLLIPELGPVQVNDLTYNQVKDLLTSRFQEELFGINVSITMGELQTISVRIIGEVKKPGSYTIANMTSLMNALFVSGGINRTGSLRNIKLKRNGEVIANFDLYDALLEGNVHNHISLHHGDVIFVPAIGATVGIGGEVKRPAIYETKSENSVGEIIRLAGGLLPTASMKSSHIERIVDGDFHTLIDLNMALGNALKTSIKNGDLVRIFAVKNIIDKVILISGHVTNPGAYQYKKNMRISDFLPSAYLMHANADTKFALLRRELRDKRRIEVKYIDLAQVFSRPHSENDLLLKERDELIIFDLAGSREKRLSGIIKDLEIQSTYDAPPMVFSVSGHVRFPGKFPLEHAARFLDVIDVAGGIQVGTDRDYALVARKTYPRGYLEMFSVQLDRALSQPLSEWNPYIHPEDKIFIFNDQIDREKVIKREVAQLLQQTRYGNGAPVVSAEGSIRHAGTYPLEPGMRVTDLLRAVGGLSDNAFGLAAELTRYQIIDGEYKVADHHFIDLANIMKGKKESDLILHSYDFLMIREKPEWFSERIVELTGEVVYPGKYTVSKDETLCNVLHRAGGLTNKAYPFGAIFSRESVRLKQQSSIISMKKRLEKLIINKQLSPGFQQSTKQAPMSNGESSKLLRQLLQDSYTKHDVFSRVVIDLEKINACNEDVDLFLEDKDKLFVPTLSYDVSVVGEVYSPGTHAFEPSQGSQDYINKSGGVTQYANNSHAFVIQANGEVTSVRSGGMLEFVGNIDIKPGATIFVPIDVDRRNTLETLQSWADIVFKLAVSMAGLSLLVTP